MEGGNWIQDGPPHPMNHAALSLLTTDHRYEMLEHALTPEQRGIYDAYAGAFAIICGFREVPDSNYGKSRTRISVSPGQGFH